MTIRRARGARINNTIIDFTSGWLVANIGHDNRAVRRAIHKAQGWAVIDRHENPWRTRAEEALCSTLPEYLRHVQFYNSGSEAIDAAIRIGGGSAIAHPRAFHGSTIGAQSIPRHGSTDLKSWPPAILVETFHGAWCEWHSTGAIDALRGHQRQFRKVIFDEMQAGFGRTGKWWGFEHYDIEPDLVVGGKAMAGGLPMAFVAGRKALMARFGAESTFSGNALCSAACVATIGEIRRRKLIERVGALELLILAAFPEAQGRGFAYAFDHPEADAVCDRALDRGLLLLHTGRDTVKICPPLTISRRDLIRGLDILRDSM